MADGMSAVRATRCVGSSPSGYGLSKSHVPWFRPGVAICTRSREPARSGAATDGIAMLASTTSPAGIGSRSSSA